jgi:hypothetical protein
MDFPSQVMVCIRYWIMGDQGRVVDPHWLGQAASCWATSSKQ